MDIAYDTENDSIVIDFEPRDTVSSAILLQLILEEQKRKKVAVPAFSEEFFKEFIFTKDKIQIEFSFEHLEFATIFLEETCHEWAAQGNDASEIVMFLKQVTDYAPSIRTLQ